MLPLILAAAAVAGLAALAVKMSRSVGRPPPMPQPARRTLADWRRARESALGAADLTHWADCACCGAPTYDPRAECALCGWAEGEPLARSRAHFAEFGTIDTPAEMAGWGELPPTDDERALIRQILDLCARAPSGEDPGTTFWDDFGGVWAALESARERRFQAAQQASFDRDAED